MHARANAYTRTRAHTTRTRARTRARTHGCDQADPRLVYFDARGVVEPTRLLLAAAEVQYEDKRYAVDMTTKPPVWLCRVRSRSAPMRVLVRRVRCTGSSRPPALKCCVRLKRAGMRLR